MAKKTSPADIFEEALSNLTVPLGKEPDFTTVTNLLFGKRLITKTERKEIALKQNEKQRGSDLAWTLDDKIEESHDPVQCLHTICDIFTNKDIEDDQLKKYGASMRSQLLAVTTENARLDDESDRNGDDHNWHDAPETLLTLPVIGDVKEEEFTYAPRQKETIYAMNTTPRGYCLIVNISKGREGSDKDALDLTNLFNDKLRFKVKVYDNLKAHEIRELAGIVNAADHSQLKCFVMVLLAHGGDGEIKGASGNAVKISDIEDKLKDCQSLHGKPKLFFVQACRGQISRAGVSFEEEDRNQEEADILITVPKEADFLLAYATTRGQAAIRHKEKGSRFIQSVVKVFEEEADHDDVLSMLTKVTNMVAQDKGISGNQHVPVTENTLRKKIYFGEPPAPPPVAAGSEKPKSQSDQPSAKRLAVSAIGTDEVDTPMPLSVTPSPLTDTLPPIPVGLNVSAVFQTHSADIISALEGIRINEAVNELHSATLISKSVYNDVNTTEGITAYKKATTVVRELQRCIDNSQDPRGCFSQACQVLLKLKDAKLNGIIAKMTGTNETSSSTHAEVPTTKAYDKLKGQTLGSGNLGEVMDKISGIAIHYQQLGHSFHIPSSKVEEIAFVHNARPWHALNATVSEWLKCNFDRTTEDGDKPNRRWLVEAVRKINAELADKI